MQQQLHLRQAIALRHAEADGFFCKGANDQQTLGFRFAGVDVELAGVAVELAVAAMTHHGQLLAQADGLAVEVQNGVWVVFLRGDIDLRIV